MIGKVVDMALRSSQRPNLIHKARLLVLCIVVALTLSIRIIDAFSLTPENVVHLKEALELPVGGQTIRPRGFAFDGDTLLVASNRLSQLWWLAAGETSSIDLTRAGGYLQTVFFSGDRPLAAFQGDTGGLTLLDMTSGAAVSRLDTPRNEFRRQWNPTADGLNLAAREQSGQALSIFNADTGERRLTIPLPDGYRMHWPVPTFSADGAMLATVLIRLDDANTHDVFLWDARDGTLIRRLGGSDMAGLIYDLAFSPDGTALLAAGSDATAEDGFGAAFQVWGVTTGIVRAAWNSGDISAHELRFTPDGRYLASYGARNVWLWAVSEPAGNLSEVILLNSTERSESFSAVAFDPSGTLLAVGRDSGEIELFDVRTGALVHAFTAHSRPVDRILFSADQRLLLSLGADHTARFWSIRGYVPYRVPVEYQGAALPTPVMTPTISGS